MATTINAERIECVQAEIDGIKNTPVESRNIKRLHNLAKQLVDLINPELRYPLKPCNDPGGGSRSPAFGKWQRDDE